MSIEIDGLELKIESSASEASSGVDKLTDALARLKTLSNGGAGLTALKKRLDELNTSLGTFRFENVSKLNTVATALKGLEGINSIKISASIPRQITAISEAANNVKWTDQDKLSGRADGLRPLSELGRSNLTSFINQLGKLPTAISDLDKAIYTGVRINPD